MNTTPLLLRNATVLTMGSSPRVISAADLLIEGGKIGFLEGRRDRLPEGLEVIDASGLVALPGLINAHTHFYSAFARGIPGIRPPSDFPSVLENLWWKLDKALSVEDCAVSAMLGCIDAIRHGTTAVIDHHAGPMAIRGSLEAMAGSVRSARIRACLCYEVSDRDGEASAADGIEENADFLRGLRRDPDSRVRGMVGLHAAFTLSDRTLSAASAAGVKVDAGFHLHVAESTIDQEHSQRMHGMSVVDRLHRFGILGPRSIAAHGVHLPDGDLDLLARTDTPVVHNPQSNLNNAVGIADISAMRAHGVTVGLGTDAMTSNMLEELRSALLSYHHRARHPWDGFGDVTATLFAGNPEIAKRCWGAPLGVLATGSPADIILVAYDPPTPLTDENLFAHIVYGLSQARVDTTIVDGHVLLRGGTLAIDIDEERLAARARELSAALWRRCGA